MRARRSCREGDQAKIIAESRGSNQRGRSGALRSLDGTEKYLPCGETVAFRRVLEGSPRRSERPRTDRSGSVTCRWQSTAAQLGAITPTARRTESSVRARQDSNL